MRNVTLIDTEIGKVPVVITDNCYNGTTIYSGTVMDCDSILIHALKEEDCIFLLKRALEVHVHFWVRNELLELNIQYEANNKGK